MSKRVTIEVPNELAEYNADDIAAFAVRGFKDWKYRTKRNKENSAIIKEYRKAQKR